MVQFKKSTDSTGRGAFSQVLINGVVSMGRRNTHTKSYLQVFQLQDSFASVDSRKTLSDQQIRRALHRPTELAGIIATWHANIGQWRTLGTVRARDEVRQIDLRISHSLCGKDFMPAVECGVCETGS